MRKFNKFLSVMFSIIMALNVFPIISICSAADESEKYEIPYFVETAPILSQEDEEETSENPDLAALAVAYGYEADTFQFPNFIMADEDIIPEDIYKEAYQTMKNSITFEEEAHGLVELINLGALGNCYGISALSVLVHNGVLTADDLYAGAETLHDIEWNYEIAKIIYYYSCSQIYHDTALAFYQDSCLASAEENVETLLSVAKRCQEDNRYFQISYQQYNDEMSFSHAVTGIGMAEGNWSFDGVSYDTCILTYDSNGISADDSSLAGGFTGQLCIYINSETDEFCVPGIGVSTQNGGCITNTTDDTELFQYRAKVKGIDSLSTDISNVAQVYYFSASYGTTLSALSEDGEWVDITEYRDGVYNDSWGNSFLIYPSSAYHIEQNNAEAYQNKIQYANGSSGIYGSTWGADYCTRYGADSAHNYAIDATPDSISVTNKGLIENVEEARNEAAAVPQMSITVSLSYDDYSYGTGYFYFKGDADEGDTVTMEKADDGVIVSSKNGNILKGWLQLYSTHDPQNISIKGSFYATNENDKMVIYLDVDGDGVYESPLENGDVDGDGDITVEDAVSVLQYYAESCASLTASRDLNTYYPLSIDTADVNGDGQITVEDAVEILTTYARRSAGLED